MKRLIPIILIVVLIIASLFLLGSCTNKGNEYISEANVDLYLQENGDVRVVEHWKVEVGSEEIHNLYREIDLYDSGTKTISELKDFRVLDNSTGHYLEEAYNLKDPEDYTNSHLDNHYYVYTRAKSNGVPTRVEIGYYMPYTSNSKLEYTMEYTITDMLTVYGDCAVLYYKPFSKGFSLFIEKIDLNIHMPNGEQTTEKTLNFLHTEIDDSYSEVRADSISSVGYNFDDQDSFEVRSLLPKEYFSGAQKVSNENKYDSFIQEELAWKTAYEEEVKREQSLTILFTVLGVVMVLLSVAMVVYLRLYYFKHKGDYPPYVREIRAGDTPAEMGHYFYHYKGGTRKQKNRGNMLAGTVMDLARKGYLELTEDPNNKDDYVIGVLNVPEAKLNELEKHERVLWNLLLSVQSSVGHPFNMSEFENYGKMNAVPTSNSILSFLNSSATEFKKADNFLPTKILGIARSISIAFILLGVFLNAMNESYFSYFIIGSIISGAILLIFTPTHKKFSEKGALRYMESEGLKSFLLDFSNLKEHEIPALILWEEYMAYATMMGISERVLEELKLKHPELMEPTTVNGGYHRSYLYFYVRMNHRSTTFDLGRSLNNSFTNVARATHALHQASTQAKRGASSIGRSGGGFRGGGGGFGGGRGGAR